MFTNPHLPIFAAAAIKAGVPFVLGLLVSQARTTFAARRSGRILRATLTRAEAELLQDLGDERQ